MTSRCLVTLIYENLLKALLCDKYSAYYTGKKIELEAKLNTYWMKYDVI